MTKIAYSKLGRSVLLDSGKWGEVGGDNEPLHLLLELAARNPDVEWIVAGRHSGDPGNLPANVTVPNLEEVKADKTGAAFTELIATIYAEADGAVSWLGQHGTSNMPIPQDKDPAKLTNPQEWSRRYAGPIIEGLNRADDRYEPVWLAADPRNYLKARDLKWYPSPDAPVLGQFDFTRSQRHYRFVDPRPPSAFDARRVSGSELSCWSSDRLKQSGVPPSNFWISEHSYVYSGLELTGVPHWEDDPELQLPWADRVHFGIIINEARSYVNPKVARAPIVRDWVNPLKPAFFHGTWKEEDGLATIGRESVEPVSYTELAPVMARAKSTLTTPSSGSGWATAKWWESAALGVVCFIHPEHDTQGHIVPLHGDGRSDTENVFIDWLRPRTPQELWSRVKAVHESQETYEWLRDLQFKWLAAARQRNQCVTTIEQRLGITPGMIPAT